MFYLYKIYIIYYIILCIVGVITCLYFSSPMWPQECRVGVTCFVIIWNSFPFSFPRPESAVLKSWQTVLVCFSALKTRQFLMQWHITIQLLEAACFSNCDQVLALILVLSPADELGLEFEIEVIDRCDWRGHGNFASYILKTVFLLHLATGVVLHII